jgi:ribosomal protein S18 acetylase RimI-like enzyme
MEDGGMEIGDKKSEKKRAINISFFEDVTGQKLFADFIGHIVNTCSDEFFPPLLGRRDTQQKMFWTKPSSDVCGGEGMYLNSLLAQSNIFATVDGKIIGLMSFIHDCHDEIFDKLGYGKNNYVSTICVDPSYRTIGAAGAMYNFIESKLPQERCAGFTSTRTWGGNAKHIRLLERRGYSLIHRIKDDREYNGQTEDTVYYAKRNNVVFQSDK